MDDDLRKALLAQVCAARVVVKDALANYQHTVQAAAAAGITHVEMIEAWGSEEGD
jgi:hypothetical protein